MGLRGFVVKTGRIQDLDPLPQTWNSVFHLSFLGGAFHVDLGERVSECSGLFVCRRGKPASKLAFWVAACARPPTTQIVRGP